MNNPELLTALLDANLIAITKEGKAALKLAISGHGVVHWSQLIKDLLKNHNVDVKSGNEALAHGLVMALKTMMEN